MQEAILEMEDDPFERKLQSNHELKEDEVREGRRRGRGEHDPGREHWQNAPEKKS